MLKTSGLAFSCLLLLAACGDGDAETPDAGVDEGMPMTVNALGELCSADGDCPADHSCVIPPLPSGSTTDGYCSPNCATTDDCTDGYEGPGSISCFMPPSCFISCGSDDDCPTGLTCLPTGGPTSACGVAGE